MENTDYIFIDGRLTEFDEFFRGWEKVFGSYYITVQRQFKDDYAELEISVKKYGCIIGAKTIDISATPRMVEEEIATIIYNKAKETEAIEAWANYKIG